MTTPSANTPLAIISDAYFDAGITQEGQTPNSEQLVNGMRRLTDIINLEQTQGLKLWLNIDTTVTLVEDQATYTFGPAGDFTYDQKPLRVLEAWYVDDNGIRRPLNPLSWRDYTQLGQINQSGTINSYFVNKKQTELSVFFWYAPDATAATGSVHLLLQTQVTNFISVTETMNFPVEWRMFLRWALADDLATGQPQAIMDRCQQRANVYREVLEGWDVEDPSTRFAPDSRGQYFGQGFR